ncbi:putative ABC transporter ATP-binding protein YxlF [Caulifigura coniformis]|uniref:Putative ABC transporter ATP-binding protein YxlF n=1 Tax=Caulifigura coniformis TaxID=2527983 RepID=A0A517SAW0_9PLAN|nr:ABC transporter ATP-binding protein [Caulifigura coniformis]QDT53252.1 putative ABC transporter ATP-binding protein YxlF [Caulifigura coniformis]
MIELDSVTKLYGTVIGVNDVSLTLGPGAHGLLGPNGSGKTTFLNLITGQLRPTRGRVRMFGENPWDNPRLYRRIGICPSFEGLYAEITARDWVIYMLRLHGFSPVEAERRALDALEIVGMTASMDRTMGSYSRGMRQRTKLAQAIAHEPELLILDEPFNGLDPVGRHEITMLLKDWVKAGGSLIIASHILYEVETLATSFLLVSGGRLLASGTPEEVHSLLKNLPNEFVIRGEGLRELSQKMIAEQLVDSIRLDGGDRLTVTTHQPTALTSRLPEWNSGGSIRITELSSGDDTLQALFTTLMRIHRGELR